MIEAKLTIDTSYEDGKASMVSNFGGDCTVLLGMIVKTKKRLDEIENDVYKYILDHNDLQKPDEPRVLQDT